MEGVYRSYSTLVLLSIPVATWDMLPDNPAVNFIGFVISDNLLQNAPLANLRSTRDPAWALTTVNDSLYDSITQTEGTTPKGMLSSLWTHANFEAPKRPTGNAALRFATTLEERKRARLRAWKAETADEHLLLIRKEDCYTTESLEHSSTRSSKDLSFI